MRNATRNNRLCTGGGLLVIAAMLLTPDALSSASGQTSSLKPGAPRAEAAAAKADDAELAIGRIILYASGVGYFERQGQVQGEQSAHLKFETGQINDILKSMVLLDLDGGRINAVTYNSKEPLARRLRSFGVDISGAPGIGELFQQLRGSRVSITGPDGVVEGVILGVEFRPIAVQDGDGKAYIQQPFVNIVTKAGVKSIMIASIASFTFADADLNEELGKALEALAEERTSDTKTVDLSFSGDPGKLRRIVVSYIHEMPVWKTSYRLVLPDEEKGAKPDAAKKTSMTLQGWAIVENTTDADWNDVRLSLASGRPVSFTMDLYEPLFTARPNVPVPVLGGVMPRLYESAMNRQDFRAANGPKDERSSREAGRDMMKASEGIAPATSAGALMSDYLAVSGADMVNYAAQAQASAGEAGETFMYTLDAPVTLERQRSAMLPILTEAVEGRRISIYNSNAFAKHPMRGVQITNGALHLMPGPISVYDGAAYAGDSQIPHTSRGQERLLSYAVDLDVLGTTESDNTGTIVKVRIVDGLIETITKQRWATTYGFTNNDQARGRTLLVEHTKMGGWDLVEPKEPKETTESLYRFEVPLEAAKVAKLNVVQEQTTRQTIALTAYDLTTLIGYAREGKASQAVVDAVKKAAAIQARINDLNRELLEIEQQRTDIGRDQERIRGNMNTIDRTSELYRRYMTKFNEQETQVETLGAKREEAVKARDAAEKELKDYIRNLDVE